ncbi:MAG: TRAP transporter permease, partial [Beijerinckiaceae bacterium]
MIKSENPSQADLQRMEEELDHELQFRPLRPAGEMLIGGLLFTLSVFHLYTAGFGLLREDLHRGVHLAFVIGMIFLVFGFRKSRDPKPDSSAFSPGGAPLYDWIAAGAAAVAALYIPY